MANQPLAFATLLGGGVLVVKAITGQSLADTIKGGKPITAAPLAGSSSASVGATPGTPSSVPGGGAIGGVINAKNLGRTDMGVDFSGAGPIPAVMGGKVDLVIPNGGPSGWPGTSLGNRTGGYIHWKGTDGLYYYVAENIDPLIKAGDTITAGQIIANARGTGALLEYGYASSTPNQTLAAATTGYTEGQQTKAGKDFLAFLKSVGL